MRYRDVLALALGAARRRGERRPRAGRGRRSRSLAARTGRCSRRCPRRSRQARAHGFRLCILSNSDPELIAASMEPHRRARSTTRSPPRRSAPTSRRTDTGARSPIATAGCRTYTSGPACSTTSGRRAELEIPSVWVNRLDEPAGDHRPIARDRRSRAASRRARRARPRVSLSLRVATRADAAGDRRPRHGERDRDSPRSARPVQRGRRARLVAAHRRGRCGRRFSTRRGHGCRDRALRPGATTPHRGQLHASGAARARRRQLCSSTGPRRARAEGRKVAAGRGSRAGHGREGASRAARLRVHPQLLPHGDRARGAAAGARLAGRVHGLRTMQPGEERLVHATMQEAFLDHWDFQPRPLRGVAPRAATSIRRSASSSATGTARSSRPSSASEERFGVGWSTCSPCARPGAGTGSARRCFDSRSGSSVRPRQRRAVGLGVDAENTTGATRLYERVGMTVAAQDDAYEKLLNPAG